MRILHKEYKQWKVKNDLQYFDSVLELYVQVRLVLFRLGQELGSGGKLIRPFQPEGHQQAPRHGIQKGPEK
jgi:hypothetical protein